LLPLVEHRFGGVVARLIWNALRKKLVEKIAMAERRRAGWSPQAVRKSLDKRTKMAADRAEELRPTVEEAISRGYRTTRQIADYLNASGIPTARNKSWREAQVCRLLARLRDKRDGARAGSPDSHEQAADRYPSWPAMMRRPLAALYCGLSAIEFDREVKAGRLPPPYSLGESELWRREEIDGFLAQLECQAD